MSIKMLFFDFRDSEKSFFNTHHFEDIDITFFSESLNEETVKNLSEEDKNNAFVISVFISSTITKDVLDEFPNLGILSTRSTGCNHLDIPECINKNIQIINVENYGATSVTQFIFGLIIALTRKIIPAVEDLKTDRITPKSYIGRDLSNLTLGAVGTGAIGSGVCKIAHAFGMKILATDIVERRNVAFLYDVQYVDKETLIKQSDIISLHVPFLPELKHMFSTPEFEMMKPTAYLINASRGELVDTQSLYEALIHNKIAGCALDALECENLILSENKFLHELKETTAECVQKALILQKLVELPNVIVTPHIAYETQDSIDYILKTTIYRIKDSLKGEITGWVN